MDRTIFVFFSDIFEVTGSLAPMEVEATTRLVDRSISNDNMILLLFCHVVEGVDAVKIPCKYFGGDPSIRYIMSFHIMTRMFSLLLA